MQLKKRLSEFARLNGGKNDRRGRTDLVNIDWSGTHPSHARHTRYAGRHTGNGDAFDGRMFVKKSLNDRGREALVQIFSDR
jgi:hypothetical protein